MIAYAQRHKSHIPSMPGLQAERPCSKFYDPVAAQTIFSHRRHRGFLSASRIAIANRVVPEIMKTAKLQNNRAKTALRKH
jgi:hypothetical protein